MLGIRGLCFVGTRCSSWSPCAGIVDFLHTRCDLGDTGSLILLDIATNGAERGDRPHLWKFATTADLLTVVKRFDRASPRLVRTAFPGTDSGAVRDYSTGPRYLSSQARVDVLVFLQGVDIGLPIITLRDIPCLINRVRSPLARPASDRRRRVCRARRASVGRSESIAGWRGRFKQDVGAGAETRTRMSGGANMDIPTDGCYTAVTACRPVVDHHSSENNFPEERR